MSRGADLDSLLQWLFQAMGLVLLLAFRWLLPLLSVGSWAATLYPGDDSAQMRFLASLIMFGIVPAGVLCLVTAWGLKRGRSWAFWTGIVGATFVVFGYPWLTPLGLVALCLLLIDLPKGAQSNQEFWDPRRESLVIVVAGIVSWVAVLRGYRFMAIVAEKQGFPPSEIQANLWLILIVVAWVHTAMHEFGHALAAWISGFRVRVINVGPITISKDSMGYHLHVDGKRFLSGGGYMGAVPGSSDNIRLKEILVVAAGPLTSLNAGLALLALFFYLPRTPWVAYWPVVALGALWGFSSFIVNLIPSGYTDGAMLFHLILRTRRSDELLAKILAGGAQDQPEPSRERGDVDHALESRRQALNSLLSGRSNPSQLASAHAELAKAELLAGFTREAETNYRKGVELLAEKTNPPLEAKCWIGLHQIAVMQYRVDDAVKAYDAAAGILETLRKKTPAEAEWLMIEAAIAELHTRGHSFSLGIESTWRTLSSLPGGEDRRHVRAVLLRLRAECQFEMGYPDLAMAALNEAADLFRAGTAPRSPRRLESIEDLAHLGVALWNAGKTDAAVTLLTEVIHLLEEAGQFQSAARHRLTLSTVQRKAGRIPEAEAALPDPKRLGDILRREYLEHRGAIRRRAGRLQEALADYQEAYRLAEADPHCDEIALAISRGALAEAHLDAGHVADAESLARQSYEVLSSAKHPEAASVCITLALTGWAKDQFIGEWLSRGLKTFEKAPFIRRATKARFLEYTAFRLGKAGLHQQAQNCLKTADAHWEAMSARRPVVIAASMVGSSS